MADPQPPTETAETRDPRSLDAALEHQAARARGEQTRWSDRRTGEPISPPASRNTLGGVMAALRRGLAETDAEEPR